MAVLTNARHERFAQELAAGKTATEAYTLAGYKPDDGHASRLAGNGRIVERVAELQGRAAEGVVLTKQWVIEKLIENVDRAMQAIPVTDREGRETGEFTYEGSVANKALELLGKEQGMFVDRKEVGKPGEFERMNADELREHIRREAAELGLGRPALARPDNQGKPH